jgi:hypothetical protein
MADTDGDGLNDGFECNSTSTDPTDQDSDGDGVSDGDEDNDSDGISNLLEQNNGMDPTTAATQGDGYKYEETVLEDAEDGLTSGWSVLSADTPTPTITNATDPDDAANKAICLSGNGTTSEYGFDVGAIPAGQLKLEWRMRYGEAYDICVKLTTDQGTRYIHYTSDTSNTLGTGESITYGLGAGGSAWKTVRRDLQKDLWDAQSGNDIISIDGITVKGSGYLDDIRTMAYVDTDRDLIPDSIELSLGLDPNDASDATGDHDSDSTSNLDEFMAGTLKRDDYDTDGDGVPDSIDQNPNSNVDTDSDGMPDDWETYYFGDLTQTATGDYDSDGVDNITEYKLGMNPNASKNTDTTDILKLRVYQP